ncbi:uncharacterized protein LOC115767276 [Drosophila novamexicana]|uniref:uncharacterized protein LOC115767276 n=1 Tax=Drosophila novamexicana TaxID=47314 RepID=UPI0011E5A202|nr:uncharacterized protein LOC115767276 [Drosophila novamexicana]
MFNWRLKLILLLAQALSGQAGYIGGELAAGVHSAGLLGSYAGALSGGEALAKLDLGASSVHADHEQLGALGEHLSEHSFPADYGSSDAGVEYAEASEHHEHHYEPEPELELDLEQHHDEQPVPGIDHGKGAFSYSTLYEFKDRQEHEQHQLEHQLEEQHIEQQLELEHQQHVLEHQLDSH